MVLHFRVGHPQADQANGPGAESEPGFSAPRSVAGLQSVLRGRLTANQSRTLASLAHEHDPELFGEGLLDLARRAENTDSLEVAAALHQWFESPECPTIPSVQARARLRRDAMEGRGEGGARAEFLLRRFVRDASDPTAIFAMGAAGALFRITRLATLGRLAATPSAGLLTRGFGARVLSSLTGFAVEATAFPFLGRLGGEALGRSHPWTVNDLSHEVAASFITLGALKFCGWGSGALYRRSQNLARGLPATFTQQAFQQTGMLGGILIGHGLEQAVGLRPRHDGATTMVDSLLMLLQFNVAGSLTRGAFGHGFHAWERSLDMQSEGLSRPALPRTPRSLFGSPALAMAGIPSGGGELVGRTDPREANLVFSKADASSQEAPPFPILGFEGESEVEANRRNRPNVHFEYPAEIDADLRRMEEQMRAPDYLEGSREDLLRKRPDPALIDRIWFHQVKDFLDRMSFVRYTELDDSILLSRMEGYSDDPRAELVLGARARLGERGKPGSEALKVIEIRMSRQDLVDSFNFDATTPEGSLNQLGVLTEFQRVLGDRLHFVDPPDRVGDRIIRVPSLSYAEALLQTAASPSRIQFHYVDGAIPRDQIMGLRSRRIVPAGLSRGMTWFGDVQNWTFPFPFTLHDAIFHGSMDSRVESGSYEFSQRIYDWLKSHGSGDARAGNFMDRLADGELGNSTGLTNGVIGQNLRIFFEDMLPAISEASSPNRDRALTELRSLLDATRNQWASELSGEVSAELRAEAEHWESLRARVDAALASPRIEVTNSQSEILLPPPLVYPPSVEAAWRHVEESFGRPGYYEGNRRRMAAHRPDPEAVDSIWRFQNEHYLRANPKIAFSVDDAQVLLELNPSEHYPHAAEILRKAYAWLGERGKEGSLARQVLVMRSDDRSETELQIQWRRHVDPMPTMGETSRFLKHGLRLLDMDNAAGRAIFPSLSLLEALYRAVHGDKVQIHEVPGAIPRDTLMSLRSRGLTPVGLTRGLTYLQDFNQEVHPFGFSAHDAYYHAGVDAQMPNHYKRTAGWFYERVQTRLPEGAIRESLLDAFSDLNVPEAENHGLGAFRTMFEKSLRNSATWVQEANSVEEFRSRVQEVRTNLSALREIVGRDFNAQTALARAKGGFLKVLATAERRIAVAQSVRERTEALAIPAPPMRYTNEILDVIYAVEARYQDPDYYKGSREDLLQRRVPLNLADQLWFAQAQDFARRIDGAELHVLDAESLMEPIGERPETFDPTLIDRAIQGLPRGVHREAREVFELSIPPERVGILDHAPELGFLALTPLLHDLEAALDQKVQLWGPREDRVILRIPSLSLTEKLIQSVHGEDRAQLHFVPGVVSRDVVADLHRRRVSPVGLTGAPLFFGEFQEVNGHGAIHPFTFAQHDAFEHASRDASIPRGVPEAAHWLYTQIRDSVPESRLREETLDRLSDLALSKDDVAEPYRGLSRILFDPLKNSLRRVLSPLPGSERKWLSEDLKIFALALDQLMRQRFPEHPELGPNLHYFEEGFESARESMSNWTSAAERNENYLNRIEYPASIQETWDTLFEHFGRKNYLSPDLESLRGNRVAGDLVDRLWTFQAQDYARNIPGVEITLRDAEVFFEPSLGRNLSPDADLLHRTIAVLGERGAPGSLARQVVEVRMPSEVFEQGFLGNEETGEKKLMLFGTFFNAEDILDRAIVIVEPGEDSLRFRIPTLSFFESLLQARFGSESANFHYTHGAIARGQAMGLRARRYSPVGLAHNPIMLGDVSELTHPFNFTAHDVFFHAVRDAAIRGTFPALAGRIYRFLEPRFARDATADYAMDRLADLEHQAAEAGSFDQLTRDLVHLMEQAYGRALVMEGGERRREFAELDSVCAGMNAWIRGEMPLHSQRPEADNILLRHWADLRRSVREEARNLSRSGRR